MDSQKDKLLHLFKLLKLGFREYKWQIALLAVLSFFGGILEGIGVNAVIPLFSLLAGGESASADRITQWIRQFFLYFQLSYNVKYLLIFIAGLFLGKAVFLFINNYFTALIRRDYARKTREELFWLFLKSNWPYLSRQKIGHLDYVLITDIHQASAILFTLSAFILTAVNMIIYSLLVFNISFGVAAWSLVFGGLSYFIFKPWFRRTRAVIGESTKAEKTIAHYVGENIIGMKTVKSLSVEKSVLKISMDYFRQLRNLHLKLDTLQNISNVSLQLTGVFFILAVFAFFYKSVGFSFASFAIIVYAVNRVFSNFQALQSEIYSLNAYAPNLASVLKYREETKEFREEVSGKKKFNFDDQLEFRNVSFVYDEEKPVLANIDFFIKKGELLGLIGPSGAGKTTIVDLLLRLLKPQSGKILLDGKEISDIDLEEWRTNVGYVSQDVFLMNDTILNNIRFYKESIGEQEVIVAAKMANSYEFIKELPNQFETVVGERGVRLSGGQRQRIALARILARKPKILILDEATSALDNESEIAVQKAIEGLRGKITVLAIAHRLSTVIDSDRLIVLEHGKIIEQGVPRELLKDQGSYFSKVYNLRK